MGLLASSTLPANTITLVYTCPAQTEVTVNVNMCTRGADSNVRLALTTGGVPTDASWYEYDYPLLSPGGAIERTAIHLTAGQCIYAYASTSTVSININGVTAAV